MAESLAEGALFRVFVCSTFDDMKAERDAIQRYVFPRLHRLCSRRGHRFQPIDLRWGIAEESSFDHRTLDVCLTEARRCREGALRPYALVLLGERYGWCPVPARIPGDEFASLCANLVGVGAGRQLAALKEWYLRDDNASPIEWTLKPRAGEFQAESRWADVERELREALLLGLAGYELSEEQARRYFASVSERELATLLNGVESADSGARPINCVAVVRHRKDAPELPQPTLAAYANGQHALRDPMARLERTEWHLRHRADVEVIDVFSTGSRDGRPSDDLPRMCQTLFRRIGTHMLAEMSRFEREGWQDRESTAHAEMVDAHGALFVGRRATLDQIQDAIGAGSRDVVVLGSEGAGKSALLARVAFERRSIGEIHCISRFIAATRASRQLEALLLGVCLELERYVGETRMSHPMPLDAVKMLAGHLARGVPNGRVVILLDDVGRLSFSAAMRFFRLLSGPRGPGIQIVFSLSSAPSGTDDGWDRFERIDIGPMSREDGELMLDAWLREAGRRLRDEQRSLLLDRFQCHPTPRVLKLLFHQAKEWRADENIANALGGLPPASDAEGLLQARLVHLEAAHGATLVSHALGLIAASRDGLHENELLDILSCDDAVLRELGDRSPFRLQGRVPPVLWARLHFDLADNLNETPRASMGVLTLEHEAIKSVVLARYLGGPLERELRHRLISYFSEGAYESGVGKASIPNVRKVRELPFQLRAAGEYKKLYQVVSEPSFIVASMRLHIDTAGEYWPDLARIGYQPEVAYQNLIFAPESYSTLVLGAIQAILDLLGRWRAARRIAEAVRDRARREGDIPGEAYALSDIGGASFKLGEYPLAIQAFEAAANSARTIFDRALLGLALHGLANTLMLVGDLADATVRFSEAIEVLAGEDELDRIRAMLGLGTTLIQQGMLDDAEPVIVEAFDSARRAGDEMMVANCAMSLASLRVERGDYPGALEILDFIEPFFRDTGRASELLQLLLQRSVVAGRLGRREELAELLLRVEQGARELSDPAVLAVALTNQARLLEASGSLIRARRKAREALQVMYSIGGGLRRMAIEETFDQIVAAAPGDDPQGPWAFLSVASAAAWRGHPGAACSRTSCTVLGPALASRLVLVGPCRVDIVGWCNACASHICLNCAGRRGPVGELEALHGEDPLKILCLGLGLAPVTAICPACEVPLGRHDVRTLVDAPEWLEELESLPVEPVPMARFARLFGVPSPEPEPNESVPERFAADHAGFVSRYAFCDICRQPRLALVREEDGCFLTILVLGGSGERISYIGSCPSCGIDQCGGCASWVADPSTNGQQGDRRPGCQRCGAMLEGKTAADLRRLAEFFDEARSVTDDSDVWFGEPRAALARVRRMLRVSYEEEPVLISMKGRVLYEQMLHTLHAWESELATS